jgi:hypothetical protein
VTINSFNSQKGGWSNIICSLQCLVKQKKRQERHPGQFEHAIDSVNLARVKRKEKKRGETWVPFNFV